MVAEVDLRILVDLAMGRVRKDLADMEREFARSMERIRGSGGKLELVSQSDLQNADALLRKANQFLSIQERLSRLMAKTGPFGVPRVVDDAAVMRDITSAVRGMPQPRLAGGMGVFGPQMGQAEGLALVTQMAQKAGLAAPQIERVHQATDKAARSMQSLATQGKFAVRVLEAFVLYRGFVFLEQSIIGSVRAMMDLDRGVSRVLTQLPNFGEGMRGAVSREILDVAKETGIAFTDVADALCQVTSAGIDGKAAFDALELSAKASVAGGTSIANAFNSALAQMSAFHMGVDDLNEIFDKQFNLVKRGIFSYEQLTTVVGITAESFYQAGQSLDTANAALAAVSETFTGPQLARGATALRNLVLAVAEKPDAFRRLGVETRDTTGNIRSLIPILEELKGSLDAMPTGERAEVLKDILPDIRQRAGALALLANMDALKRNYVEQRLALGDLDRAYDVVHGDIRAQTDVLKTNIQSGFKPLAFAIGLTVEGVNKLDKMMPGFTSNLIGTTAAVTGLAIAWQYLNQSVMMGTGAGAQQVRRLDALKGFLKSPAFRYGAAGVIGAGVGSGVQSRFDSSPGSFFGAVGGGAATGAAFGAIGGGAPGAGIGAAIGGLTSALSFGISAWRDSMEDTSKQGGVTFAEAFAESLKANKGELATSLAEAFDASRAVQQQNAINTYLATIGGPTAAQTMQFEAERQRLMGMGPGDSANVPDVIGGTSSTRYKPPEFFANIPAAVDPRVAAAEQQRAGFEAARLAAIAAREEFNSPENLANIEFYVREQNRAGVATDLTQFTDDARRQFVENAMVNAFPAGSPQAAGQFAVQMADAVDNLDAWNAALEALVAGDLPAFYDALNSMSEAALELTRVWELSANTFEDSLMHAADVIRNGVAESAGYTADELEMLAEEFADLNRVVKKVGLIKELEGIGQFLFDDPNFQLNELRKQLLNDARLGGQQIRDLLNDPQGLLKLVDTLIEFGDVNVDQSNNNNIVIRISGGTNLDTLKAAEIGDAILRELTNAQRANR